MDLTDEPDEKLMRAVNFSLDDLDANRHGLLTAKQRDEIRWWRFVEIMSLCILTLMVVGLCFCTHPSFADGVIMLLIILILPVLYGVWLHRRVERALRPGKVAKYRGYASCFGKPVNLYINQRSFKIMWKNPCKVFVERRFYTIYYVPGLDIVVSAEGYTNSKKARKSMRQKRQHETAAESEYQD